MVIADQEALLYHAGYVFVDTGLVVIVAVGHIVTALPVLRGPGVIEVKVEGALCGPVVALLGEVGLHRGKGQEVFVVQLLVPDVFPVVGIGHDGVAL